MKTPEERRAYTSVEEQLKEIMKLKTEKMKKKYEDEAEEKYSELLKNTQHEKDKAVKDKELVVKDKQLLQQNYNDLQLNCKTAIENERKYLQLTNEYKTELEKRNNEYTKLQEEYRQFKDTRGQKFVPKESLVNLQRKYMRLENTYKDMENDSKELEIAKEKIKNLNIELKTEKDKQIEASKQAQKHINKYELLENKYNQLVGEKYEDKVKNMKNEIDTLKSTIKEKEKLYDQQLKINENRYNKLFNKIGAQMENPDFDALIKECTDSMGKANKFENLYKNEQVDHTKTKSDLELKLKELNRNIELKEKHLESEEINKLKAQYNTLADKKLEVETKLKDDIQNLQQTVNKLRRELDVGKFQKEMGENEENKNKVKTLQSKITEIERKLQQEKDERAVVQDKLTKALKCCDLLEHTIEKNLNNQSDIYKRIKNIIDLSNVQIKSSQEIASQLVDTLQYKGRQKEQTKMDVDEDKMKTLNDKIDTLNDENKQLKNTITENRKKYEDKLKQTREQQTKMDVDTLQQFKLDVVNKMSVYIRFILDNKNGLINAFNQILNQYVGDPNAPITENGIKMVNEVLDEFGKSYNQIQEQALQIVDFIHKETAKVIREKVNTYTMSKLRTPVYKGPKALPAPLKQEPILGKPTIKRKNEPLIKMAITEPQEEEKEAYQRGEQSKKTRWNPQGTEQLNIPPPKELSQQQTTQPKQQIDIDKPESTFDPDVDITGLGKRKFKIPGLYES